MKIRVYVTLKDGVLDPQGVAIEKSLQHLGHNNIKGARVGKIIDLEIGESDRKKAEGEIKIMCEKLLANTVIENFTYDILSEQVVAKAK
ncbi:MAG: phosphoribosylformylglycinamidine synthase subunit PurS [Dongiaceae bacterium]